VSVREDPRYLVVGQIKKAHGVRGEVSVQPLTDHPESSFAPGVVLYLEGGGRRIEEGATPLVVVGARTSNRGVLVHFEGLASRDEAEALRDIYLVRPFDELEAKEEGEFFHHELVGLRVMTGSGDEVGTVVGVYEARSSDLLEVSRAEGSSLMVPFVGHIVKSVDLEAGTITIEPPEGLLEL
jgi:16S rRNA processing protein RimM